MCSSPLYLGYLPFLVLSITRLLIIIWCFYLRWYYLIVFLCFMHGPWLMSVKQNLDHNRCIKVCWRTKEKSGKTESGHGQCTNFNRPKSFARGICFLFFFYKPKYIHNPFCIITKKPSMWYSTLWYIYIYIYVSVCVCFFEKMYDWSNGVLMHECRKFGSMYIELHFLDNIYLQVAVETVGKGFVVNVISAKSCPGLLVSILEAFEEIGLSVLDARVSCTDTFRFQAIGEVRYRIVYDSIHAY